MKSVMLTGPKTGWSKYAAHTDALRIEHDSRSMLGQLQEAVLQVQAQYVS